MSRWRWGLRAPPTHARRGPHTAPPPPQVNPLFKHEFKELPEGYRKVPILIDGDGEQLNGSSAIIDRLISKHPGELRVPLLGASEVQAAHVQRWRRWVDEELVHLLTANIYRTWPEAVQTFDYLVDKGNFPLLERTLARGFGAVFMYALSHLKLNAKYGITEPRAEVYAALGTFLAARDGRFLLGDRESVADIEVFGVLRAVSQYDVFPDLMANVAGLAECGGAAPAVAPAAEAPHAAHRYYEDMRSAVGTG